MTFTIPTYTLYKSMITAEIMISRVKSCQFHTCNAIILGQYCFLSPSPIIKCRVSSNAAISSIYNNRKPQSIIVHVYSSTVIPNFHSLLLIYSIQRSSQSYWYTVFKHLQTITVTKICIVIQNHNKSKIHPSIHLTVEIPPKC